MGQSVPFVSVANQFLSINDRTGIASFESFVLRWVEQNRDDNGQWNLGTKAKDGIYFPLSDSWRKEETRKADCTYRIENIIKKLR